MQSEYTPTGLGGALGEMLEGQRLGRRRWVRRVRQTRKARNKGRGGFGQNQQGSLQI